MRFLSIIIVLLFSAACSTSGPPNLVNFDYQIRSVATAGGASSLGRALIDGRRADEMIDRSQPVCRVAMASPEAPELDVRGVPGVDENANLTLNEPNVRNKSSLDTCDDHRVLNFKIALEKLENLGVLTRGPEAKIEVEIEEEVEEDEPPRFRREIYEEGTIVGTVDNHNRMTTWTEGRFEAVLTLEGNSQFIMIIRDGSFALTD